MHKPSAYNVAISLAAALGSLTYGYAAAILGNTVGKATFFEYMKLDENGPGKAHTSSVIAWWNTILYVGGWVACLACPYISDKYGRKRSIALGAMVCVVGSALQAGTISADMLIASRLLIGIGIGILLAAVPLYQAEISPPSSRGLIVGIHASMIGFGSMIASWIGVAFYHIRGSAGWRVPLALQIPFPLLLFVLIWFLPESPRWLYMHDRAAEAEKVLIELHGSGKHHDSVFARKEFTIIRQQIDFEKQNRLSLRQALMKRSLQKRFLFGWLAMCNTQCSGLIVVLAYQSVIYTSLGFSPFMAGIFGAIWCVINGSANLMGGIIGDYIGRKKQIVWGLSIILCLLIVLCITTYLYSGTDNKAGNITACVFTFLIILVYGLGVDCPSLVYSSELFPGEWRAMGVAISLSAVLFWCCIFTAAASPAFEHIGALYYIVFIVLTAIQTVIVAVFFPDTKGFTLEQTAALFNDPVINMQGRMEKAEDFMKEHTSIEHVELAD